SKLAVAATHIIRDVLHTSLLNFDQSLAEISGFFKTKLVSSLTTVMLALQGCTITSVEIKFQPLSLPVSFT
ncbi:14804_t:CDS:1, partial [Funneliformis mosseae]